MKRFIPIVIVIVLISLLSFINRGMNKSLDPADQEQPPAPAQAAGKPAAAGIPDPFAPEITSGDPSKSKYKIQLGWIYDEAAQKDPSHLGEVLSSLQSLVGSNPNKYSMECVNLDLPMAERSPAARTVQDLGVFVNGKSVVTSNNHTIDLSGNPGYNTNTPSVIIGTIATLK